MKLVEKRAEEWWQEQRRLMIHGDPVSYAPDPISYQAGFRAALELAADECGIWLYATPSKLFNGILAIADQEVARSEKAEAGEE